jgi:23S rRNA (adenine2503-C2)-methyltransferase
MGMGEPLINYDQTMKALRLINQEIKIGARQLTLSTAGHVPGIKRLSSEEMQFTLAVSLHAGAEKVRRLVVPGMKYPLFEIIEACKDYIAATNRRISFEYCLIRDINDSNEQARLLAKLIQDMNCHVNLIPYNKVRQLPLFPPTINQINSFEEILKNSGINVTRRVQRGADIDAACGQLRHKFEAS